MKMLIYAALVVAALLVPTTPQELGKLKPVEVIRVEKRGEFVLLETDTGDSGHGKTVNQAIWNLRETAAGTVYMDTAAYVLLPEEEESVLCQLRPYLKESVGLCNWEGDIKLDKAAKYLHAHSPKVKLEDYWEGMPLQILKGEKDTLRLLEKNIERRAKTS